MYSSLSIKSKFQPTMVNIRKLATSVQEVANAGSAAYTTSLNWSAVGLSRIDALIFEMNGFKTRIVRLPD